ncbi:MAG: KamA family radical SAM protein [Parachlamydiales bacterium]|nr:KamA family radical SAM protein [Parachlamydiales bacterium]
MIPLSTKSQAIPVWRQVQKNNFNRIELLLDFLEMAPDKREKILLRPNFALNIPFRLAAKMEKNSLNDPIFKQFVPLKEESDTSFGVLEPLEDQNFRKSQKLLKKYRGRALMLATGACAMNCRFCFRQNFPYETEEKSFQQELALIAMDPTISEIILSGGDPLSLSDGSLASLFQALDEIPHLRRIRFHTRFPIGIPERIDDSFLAILSSSSKQVIFIIHCNHPKELDEEVAGALKKIQKLGIPVLNQSVLLKGVNDDERTLLSLCESLVNAGILPYYLHLHDPVRGTGHFDVPEERGLDLIRFLQENLSGYGVPHLVREEPGKPSKTFKI